MDCYYYEGNTGCGDLEYNHRVVYTVCGSHCLRGTSWGFVDLLVGGTITKLYTFHLGESLVDPQANDDSCSCRQRCVLERYLQVCT